MAFLPKNQLILTQKTMKTNNDLKNILIDTILMQLAILSASKKQDYSYQIEKIISLALLSEEELIQISDIYQDQINALVIQKRNKLVGNTLNPFDFCQN